MQLFHFSFQPTFVERGSKAAACLCQWIHAVYRYVKKARELQPDLAALAKAEKNLAQAQAILGSKRVRLITQEINDF